MAIIGLSSEKVSNNGSFGSLGKFDWVPQHFLGPKAKVVPHLEKG